MTLVLLWTFFSLGAGAPGPAVAVAAPAAVGRAAVGDPLRAQSPTARGIARLPLVPGHQIVGAVNALGPGVTSLALGEHVGVP